MNYDCKSYGYKKIKRKRLLPLIVVLFFLSFMRPVQASKDWFFYGTSQVIPLLTYEREYGILDASYCADYQVPEWFFEEKPENADTVMEEGNTEQEEAAQKEEKVETLADGTKGVAFTRKQLQKKDVLLSKIFSVDANTSMTKEELSLKNLLDKDLSIDGIKNSIGENGEKQYKILIYHTHGSEAFADSRKGKKEDTIIGVGTYLTQLLEEQYGIATYHDETVYDVVDGKLDRSYAYENAAANVKKILEKYPSIEVVIDLHRDGVDEELHLVTNVNGKETAKIMFLNGVSRSNMNGDITYLENPNKLDNLAFSFQMFLLGKQNYGDYVRKIYVRSLRYNLHLMPRATLIEAGAQNNTLQEEKNAMEPLAAILNEVLAPK
ncbi:MAG: stage II sporulation protein P [Lachnospiraceae bacterium]|nr:stage II sporulation protein P [Lachnospiraceae bacterium]